MKKTDQICLSIDDIRCASETIRAEILRTPLIAAPMLSKITGAELIVKYENLQVTNSFKVRGALNKLLSLSEQEKSRGVIAMSAGNHAQAVAYHASRLGLSATIVMPEGTPFVKVQSSEAWGAEVVLSGKSLQDCHSLVNQMIDQRHLTLIHPYDDPKIMAGQGTIALEIYEDQPDLEQLIVPIGGGGLISGIAVAAKALTPELEIIGVECDRYPSMTRALGCNIKEVPGPTIAEGIAVKDVGKLTLPIVEQLVSEIIVVKEETLERAVSALLTVQKTMVEGAGAAGLAAILTHPEKFKNKKTGLILSGGNMDPRILSSILIRELERENKIITLRLQSDDQPGTLGVIATEIGKCGANILEVSHRRMFLDVPAKSATIDIIIEIRDAQHASAVIESLTKYGFQVLEL